MNRKYGGIADLLLIVIMESDVLDELATSKPFTYNIKATYFLVGILKIESRHYEELNRR